MLKRPPAPKQTYTCKNELEQLSTEHVKYYAGCSDNKSKPVSLIVKLVLMSADDSDKEIIDRELEFIKLITPAIKTDNKLASAIRRMYDATGRYLYSDGQPLISNTYKTIFMAYYDKSLYDYLHGTDINTEVCKSILSKFVYDIGDALVYLHKRGIIHFNVNSKSILIRRTHTKNNQPGANIKLMLSGFSLYKTQNGEGADAPVVNKEELFAAAATSPLHQYFDYLYLNNHGFTVPLAPAKAIQGKYPAYILLRKHCKEYKKEHWYSLKSYCTEFPDKISYYHDWFGYFCVIYNILSRMYLGSYGEFNYKKGNKNNVYKGTRAINSPINFNINLFRGTKLYDILRQLIIYDLELFFTDNDNSAHFEAYITSIRSSQDKLLPTEFNFNDNTLLFNGKAYISLDKDKENNITAENTSIVENNIVKKNNPLVLCKIQELPYLILLIIYIQ